MAYANLFFIILHSKHMSIFFGMFSHLKEKTFQFTEKTLLYVCIHQASPTGWHLTYQIFHVISDIKSKAVTPYLLLKCLFKCDKSTKPHSVTAR